MQPKSRLLDSRPKTSARKLQNTETTKTLKMESQTKKTFEIGPPFSSGWSFHKRKKTSRFNAKKR
jgi:hypothetical protein